MCPNLTTTWQPIRLRTDAVSRMGTRVPAGDAGAYPILKGIRRAASFGRGAVVPNGIVLKEGET